MKKEHGNHRKNDLKAEANTIGYMDCKKGKHIQSDSDVPGSLAYVSCTRK